MELTNRNSLLAAAVAIIAITAGLGIADSQSSARQAAAAPASTESFVYFPAHYALDTPTQVSEHIQAF